MKIRLEEIDRVPLDRIPEALGALEKARAALWVRLVVPEPERHSEILRKSKETGFLTVPQVAERLQVGTRWVYRHSGKLGAVRLEGRVRVPEDGLERYLHERRK